MTLWGRTAAVSAVALTALWASACTTGSQARSGGEGGSGSSEEAGAGRGGSASGAGGPASAGGAGVAQGGGAGDAGLRRSDGSAPRRDSGKAASDGGADSSTSGGDSGVAIAIAPRSANVLAGGAVQLVATVANDSGNAGVTWSVTGPGAIDALGSYSAPSGAPSGVATVTATSKADATRTASVTVRIVATGQVVPTANLLVAKYIVTSPTPATVSVRFGPTTSYGFVTGVTPVGSSAAGALVAGMRPSTTYHLRAVLAFEDGSELEDVDHTFTTPALPLGFVPQFTATTTPGMAPQSGIEMVDLVAGPVQTQAQIVATDLAGNVVWYYGAVGTADDTVQPIQALPNGDFLVQITPGSEAPFRPPPLLGTLDSVREVDLVGNTVRELTVDDLNARLPAAAQSGCTECNFVADVLHHDARALPNGHWIVMTNTTMACADIAGCTGSATNILGDVVVELDASLEPVWAWNEFNHLDVNRRPYQFPDWTHSNAVLYSPGDGNLLVSIRHQSWVVKVDYRDGKGTGDILWRLGLEGDFTLESSTSPADWFNAQHEPSFVGASTTGKFSMAVFDNGTYRPFPASAPCGGAGVPCLYSTVPILDVDEQAKTAKIAFSHPSPYYSYFGGNAEVLANGNVEFDVANGPTKTGIESDVYEITRDANPTQVWQLNVKGRLAYRAHRMPSLYPGVAW